MYRVYYKTLVGTGVGWAVSEVQEDVLFGRG